MPSSVDQRKTDFTGIVDIDIPKVWKDVAPLLAPALAEGETVEDVLLALIKRRAQLWIAATETTIEAACVTEIINKGKRKRCNLWLAGGRGVNNWLYHIETIEAWARANNCDAMIVDRARLGWQRLLKGYLPVTVTLKKEL